MICKNCGKEIKDNDKFCEYCGFQLTGIDNNTNANINPANLPAMPQFANIYEYKAIAIPTNISCSGQSDFGVEIATFVQNTINKEAEKGWEFYRTDTYTLTEAQGCLMALFGQQGRIETHNVLVFRKISKNSIDNIKQ